MKKIFLILITGLLWCSVGNAGLNVELHIVKGGHDAKVTLLGKLGKDIVKDALK
jgi:ATP-dependent Lon protease